MVRAIERGFRRGTDRGRDGHRACGRNVHLSDILSGNVEAFDPETLSFTPLNPPGKLDINNEEVEQDWFRFKDGKIVEAWSKIDTADVFQQLGVLPKGSPPRALVWLMTRLQRLRRRKSKHTD